MFRLGFKKFFLINPDGKLFKFIKSLLDHCYVLLFFTLIHALTFIQLDTILRDIYLDVKRSYKSKPAELKTRDYEGVKLNRNKVQNNIRKSISGIRFRY